MPISLIKKVVKKGLASDYGWKLAALLRKRGVVALTYHRINAGADHFPGMALSEFREQMCWIKKNCTPIWPEEIFDLGQRSSRVRPPVVITFDDGYRDYLDAAYPILRELEIPAVMFLATDFMDRGGLIWTDMLYWSGMRSPKKSIKLPWLTDTQFQLSSKQERLAFISNAKHFLKESNNFNRQRWLAELLTELDAPSPEDDIGRQMLSWDEVRASLDGTRFGGHSHTHPIMSQLQPAEVNYEIQTCRDRITAETGETPHYFAYPNGRSIDFNDGTKDALRQHGFTMAFTTLEGIIDPYSDRFALRRQPSGAATIGNFATLVARAGL